MHMSMLVAGKDILTNNKYNRTRKELEQKMSKYFDKIKNWKESL